MNLQVRLALLLVPCLYQAGCSAEPHPADQRHIQRDARGSDADAVTPQSSDTLRQDGRSGEDHFGEANNLADGHKHEEALKEYRLAIAKGYDTADLRYEMGSVLAKQLNRHEEAVEQFRLAVQRDEGYWRAHWALTQSLLKIKQYDEVLKEIEVVKELDPREERQPIYAYYNARALEGLNRYREALQNYEIYLQYESSIAPNSKEAREVRDKIKVIKEKMQSAQ